MAFAIIVGNSWTVISTEKSQSSGLSLVAVNAVVPTGGAKDTPFTTPPSHEIVPQLMDVASNVTSSPKQISVSETDVVKSSQSIIIG